MTGEDTQFDLYQAVKNLLKSELYLTRLRRVLKNGWDPKVFADFLVMDDVYLMTAVASWPLDTSLQVLRDRAFVKALESTERQLDVRVHDQVRKLEKYLRSVRPVGLPADQVLDKVHGPPKKLCWPGPPTPRSESY